MLLALVNGFGAEHRAAAGASGLDYPHLDLPREFASIGDRRLAELADVLWQVFDAASDSARRADLLTGVLDAAGLHPTIEEPGVLVWATRHRARADRLGAACAAALAQAVDRLGWTRIGTCAGADCVDALIDDTRGTARIYCSATCLNRSKVRAYRARRASQPRAEP
jgi:predicted RNA-binding Zn ribbon-like protein